MKSNSLDANPPRAWLYSPPFDDAWTVHQLWDLAEWVNGLAFRDISFTPQGRPVIKIAEIKNGISGQTKFTQDEYNEKVLVRSGDMLFAWSGQPETSIDVSWWRGEEGWLNQHIFRVTPDETLCSKKYFYYLLRHLRPNFVAIARNKQTTGLGHVTRKDLENIRVSVPPLAEQQRIAHILGTLDDKIELNRRMNATLEAMARALFKSWFVDFDPVRAKAAGRDPGLPADIAALFPAAFVESALGEAPEGWGAKNLGAVIELAYGKALKAEDRRAGDVPVFGSNGQIGWHDESLVSGPGIIVGRKGNAGTVKWSQLPFFPIDTAFYVVPNEASMTMTWLFFALENQNLPNQSADSAVPGLSRSIAYRNLICLPRSDALVQSFDRFAAPLFERMQLCNEESRTLAALRDTLLPRLLSGEVRVR